MATPAPPRRFKIEPIESTMKSSKDRQREENEPSKRLRKFAPEPVETTAKTSRRFAPEPLENTTRTHRRFAPEPTETSERSSRKKFAEEWESQTTRKFKPEPLETPASSNRKKQGINQQAKIDATSSSSQRTGKRPPRKFAPQLIETARRSRRAGDAAPVIRPSDRTEATPVDNSQTPPDNTPTINYSQNPLRRPMSRISHHSFRVPDLDPIESSESEGSIVSDRSQYYKEATRMRESVDDRFSGYLLELAAKAAERQLREQAMAAFPNDDHHEPVDHFIDRDDDTESYIDEGVRRRDSSFNEVNWELVAMRQHRQKLEQQQETEREMKRRREAEMNRYDGPWGSPAVFMGATAARNIVGGYQKDGELDRMRKGARPPMLGADIKFPRCRSPEPARFDPTQGCDASQAAEKGEGLWCGNGNDRQPSKVPSLWSNGSSRPPSRGGLWHGCCVNSGHTSPKGPTGILTPRVEKDNPLETPCPTPATSLLPPTPPASNADFACIDEKLAFEQSIDEEFGDDFVTQVYNYLSLGYPSMARPFDEELSKISGISIADLRQDDHLAKSRGYIRLGADGNLASAAITEESCMRWRALRIYIREWAKQHPGMAGESVAGGMGTAVRRGSWAI
ncbi:hypothetical protein BU26DRAFT_528417 [Trematosphaeria pertusa]|uniref:Uncharacterized protein n=1 Tax=Trematosphaeria pertusa TaxID=390896 RepID=A0A6A6IRV2_9PLEO|nr:uncharacterized protein BU26DRAFT_528417 [Trematosphaeria pertusa]KAF2253126.1 hypothetical protein BU26DRAFT_528417 [Trematosphaeria pertusa]